MGHWYAWGDESDTQSIPPRIAMLLESALGVRASAPPVAALEDVRLAESVLPPTVLADLAAAVGSEHVRTAAEDRVRHTRGKSTVDLLRLRAGDATDAPDAVVLPGSHDEVVAVLRICSDARVAVVPYGGGTSVVGGLAPDRSGFAGVICLDLARLNRLLSVDDESRVAVLEAGVRAPDAERLLVEHAFTLGHFPQSFEYASIGGFAATRSSGQFSAGYGRFDDMVVGLRVATPMGTVELGRAPRSAAGPDLRQLFLGSEGTLGVITAVSVRVTSTPLSRSVQAWSFPSFEEGAARIRAIVQDGLVPSMMRLSDEYETALTMSGVDGCLLLVAHDSLLTPQVTASVLEAGGGVRLSDEIGRDWLRTRYDAPYLRDALLGAGALAESLETATFWSNLPALYEAVRGALLSTLDGLGTPPAVLCHISHVYPTGASLYFTVVCAQTDDPVAQWRTAKQAANSAILAAGGTITHHHAVGTDHATALAAEIGPLGIAALRALKREFDPAGILNPGVLMGSP